MDIEFIKAFKSIVVSEIVIGFPDNISSCISLINVLTPVEIAKATTNGTKVYFVNAEKWTTVKVYAFSYSPKDTKNANWPGANATKESDKIGEYDVYSFTMNKEYDYCIFTNGASSNTKQTADLVVMDGADKYYCKDDWYTKEEAIAKLVAPIEYETVYFVNAADWTGTISAYAYTPVQNAAWPGEPAAKEDYQIGGKNVYSYTAEKGKYKNVIFSGTGGQTADLTWTDGAGKYYVRDNWYTKEITDQNGDPYPLLGSSGEPTESLQNGVYSVKSAESAEIFRLFTIIQ